jgi:1-acyl-sn-glycerol-3-phosphate acyltransferase
MDFLGYIVRCVITILLLVPWYLLGIIVGMVDQQAALRLFISCNKFILKLFGIKVWVVNENENKDTSNGCVFVLLNQTSLLDGSIGATILPFPWRAIVNIEYALIPVFGWAMVIFSWVIVRQWPKQAQKALKKVEAYLQSGGNIWMSIEGKRSRGGSLSPYKKGPVVLAINAKAKIVPVVHFGADECWPFGKWMICPGNIKVKFLPYISTQGLEYRDREIVIRKLRAIAREELS